MMVKAIFFDLGDTILHFGKVDIDRVFTEGAKLTYAYLAQVAGGADRLPAFNRYHRRHIRVIKWRYFLSRLERREFDCLAMLDDQARRLGLRLDRRQLNELGYLWYQPLAASARLEPDVHATLTTLQEMGVSLAVVSNTFIPSQAHDRHLEELDLLRFFPVRIYSSDTFFRKPDRRIFRRALEQTGADPRQTLMIGDRYLFDVRGARRMNITPVFLRGPTNRHRPLPGRVDTIESLAELPRFIRRRQAPPPGG